MTGFSLHWVFSLQKFLFYFFFKVSQLCVTCIPFFLSLSPISQSHPSRSSLSSLSALILLTITLKTRKCPASNYRPLKKVLHYYNVPISKHEWVRMFSLLLFFFPLLLVFGIVMHSFRDRFFIAFFSHISRLFAVLWITLLFHNSAIQRETETVFEILIWIL